MRQVLQHIEHLARLTRWKDRESALGVTLADLPWVHDDPALKEAWRAGQTCVLAGVRSCRSERRAGSAARCGG